MAVFARDLFSSAIGAEAGGNSKTASAQAVRARIAELVTNEAAPDGVLSDDALVALFGHVHGGGDGAPHRCQI